MARVWQFSSCLAPHGSASARRDGCGADWPGFPSYTKYGYKNALPRQSGEGCFQCFLQRGYLVEGAAPELGPGREHAHSRAGKDALELLRHGGEVGVRASEHLRAALPAHLVGDAAEVEVVGLLALCLLYTSRCV